MNIKQEIELYFAKTNQTESFTRESWNSEKRQFRCGKNGFGQWWPVMYWGDPSKPFEHWYPVYIRDSNPFKTLSGAIKYVESYIEICAKREAHKAQQQSMLGD